jgi:hypothetical protein
VLQACEGNKGRVNNDTPSYEADTERLQACTRREQCASDLQGGGQALLDDRQPQVMNSAEQVQQGGQDPAQVRPHGVGERRTGGAGGRGRSAG